MKQTILRFLRKVKIFFRKTEKKQSWIFRMREILFPLSLFILSLSFSAEGRDFLSSVENASNQIRQIIAVVGVLALMIAGVCFYWSKRLGMEKLSAAIIGTVVFAAASTIFTLFYQAFN